MLGAVRCLLHFMPAFNIWTVKTSAFSFYLNVTDVLPTPNLLQTKTWNLWMCLIVNLWGTAVISLWWICLCDYVLLLDIVLRMLVNCLLTTDLHNRSRGLYYLNTESLLQWPDHCNMTSFENGLKAYISISILKFSDQSSTGFIQKRSRRKTADVEKGDRATKVFVRHPLSVIVTVACEGQSFYQAWNN